MSIACIISERNVVCEICCCCFFGAANLYDSSAEVLQLSVDMKKRVKVLPSVRARKRHRGRAIADEMSRICLSNQDDDPMDCVGGMHPLQEQSTEEEFQGLWSQLPLELKERVLQHLPTSSVVRFACTLSTGWHWTFLGGYHKFPKGFVETFMRPILLRSILATVQRYNKSIKLTYVRS